MEPSIVAPRRPSGATSAPTDTGVTRYVRSGAGHVAFQVLGAGTPDILVVNESVMPLEALADNAHTASYLAHLAAWGRVILFDRRGVGLSDPATPGLTLDDWVADAVAALDAAGSTRAAVVSFGPSAGLIAMRLAATRPDRVSFLGVYDAIARYRWAPDHPWGVTEDVARRIAARMSGDWGTARFADRRGRFAATAAVQPGFVDWAITWFRRGAGPASLAAHDEVLQRADVRAELVDIRCPTVVFNHAGVDDGPFIAARIAGARYVELRDPCHVLFSPEVDEVLALTGAALERRVAGPATRQVLTTVLVTDVVEVVPPLVGDDDPLARHRDHVRQHLRRFEGAEVTARDDCVSATFDAPSRAARCALAIVADAARSGVTVRVGVHAGEVDVAADGISGPSVHAAQRLCALAAGSQVLTTQRVVDLVSGADLRFEHVGDHHLVGSPGRGATFEVLRAPRQLACDPGAGTTTGRPLDLTDVSPREREVLAALATGASNADIGAALFMSEATVKAHVSHLLVKLDRANRVQLAVLAHVAGLVAAP